MTFLTREINSYAQELSKQYPILGLMGPRQSGKTTLSKTLFPQKPYVSLEDPDIRHYAIEDPRGFLNQYPDGAILDEIQRTPDLLSYLQTQVDQDERKGLFVLTGSHQLMLHQAINQSLAGRIALLTLLPFSLSELQQIKQSFTVNELLYQGFYPRIYRDHLNPTDAYRNYFQTYVERDVRALIQLKNLITFERFIKLCAGRVGQIINYQSLANDTGVSTSTVKEWLSILSASYIITLLPPYFENIGKRLIKSPKLYFVDVGLATYLLGIENASQLQHDRLRGSLFENLVMVDLMKQRLNQGRDPNLFFYRDQSGVEIDLLYKQGPHFIPIEIKSSETFDPSFTRSLDYFKSLLQERVPQKFLIYNGETQMHFKETQIINLKSAAKLLTTLI